MWEIAIGSFVGLVLLAPAAYAQFARQEVIAFESAMMPPEAFLAGKKGTTVTLAGYLRLPGANGKNPVVVLFHCVGGLGGAGSPVHEWSRVLNEAGIGTFAVANARKARRPVRRAHPPRTFYWIVANASRVGAKAT